jgi:hypothetical protein
VQNPNLRIVLLTLLILPYDTSAVETASLNTLNENKPVFKEVSRAPHTVHDCSYFIELYSSVNKIWTETKKLNVLKWREPGSSGSIVSWLRTGPQGGRGSIPGSGKGFFPVASVSRPALGPTQPPVQWVQRVLSPGVKRGRGVTLTTHPHLELKSIMSRSYTSSSPSAFMAFSGTVLAVLISKLGTILY